VAEFGIVILKGIGQSGKRTVVLLEDGENGLSCVMRQLLERLHEHLKRFDRQVNELEAQIQGWH
jgi:hypothetical protein